ncbi:uncharacterized protein LOC117293068 [Asterias rubens]|uniref:uncharacterized protein LOC117293068 n=1 Tax=Asterias rubens TaxID=7604 RepID=UPI001455255E|nr:uncharacterized protein LOC117293068 [Asterias rubens]
MYERGKANLRYQCLLTLSVTVIFYVMPLKGDMCASMVSVINGEEDSTLQERAFENFKSTCRKLRSGSAPDKTATCSGPLTPSSGQSKERYPTAGFFDHPLERLEFSVQSTGNVILDLKCSDGNFVAIELGTTSTIYNRTLKKLAGIHTIDIGTSSHFWVTYTNNIMKVGRDGEAASFMEADIPNMEINYISFDPYGTSAQWQIYNLCVEAY